MFSLRAIRQNLPVGIGYFALATLSILTTRVDNGPAVLWIAASLLIAVLKRRSVAEWRGPVAACAIASIAATGLVGAGWALAVPLMIGNMAEATSAAYVFRRLHSPSRPIGSMGWIATVVVAGGLVGPLAMASVSALPLWLLADQPVASTFARVVAGHGLSNIVGLPIFALFGAGLRDAGRGQSAKTNRAEIAALFAVQTAINILVFSQDTAPLLFLAVLPSVVIAFRCQSRAAAASLVLLALIAGVATLRGDGPIHLFNASVPQRLLLLSFYLLTIVLTIVPIAAGLRLQAHLLRRVSDSEQRYRMLADHSGDIIMHSDSKGRIRFVSPSIARAGGYRPEEVAGTNCLDMIHPAFHETALAHYGFAMIDGLDTRFEYRARRKDGRWGWFESDCRGVTDPDGAKGVVSVVRDITERKMREEQLATAAMTDSLTGLPNRRAFREAAARIIGDQRRRTASVALIDIDHFKAINDTYGHDAGDEVLQSFAAVAQQLRRKEDIMARVGGEEFAILLPDTDIASALAVCDRLRREIAQSVCVTASGPIRITVSGGVALLDTDGLDATLRRADDALYVAKREGRDRLIKAAA